MRFRMATLDARVHERARKPQHIEGGRVFHAASMAPAARRVKAAVSPPQPPRAQIRPETSLEQHRPSVPPRRSLTPESGENAHIAPDYGDGSNFTSATTATTMPAACSHNAR